MGGTGRSSDFDKCAPTMPLGRISLVAVLVSLGEELNSLAESGLQTEEVLDRCALLTAYRRTLWSQLGVDESTLA